MLKNTRESQLRTELLTLGDGESFTGRDGVEGVLVVGALGAGKTSGSGCTLARALLAAGWGGLVLTTKADELDMWVQTYFDATGRSPSDDLVVLQPAELHPAAIWPAHVLGRPPSYRLNLLNYEFIQGGGLTANVVDVLFSGLATREAKASVDPFWDQSLYEMTLHALELVILGTTIRTGRPDIRLDDVLAVIVSAPTSSDELDSKKFRSGRCYELIAGADEGRDALSDARYKDLQLSVRYWLHQFPSLAPETRSSIVAQFTSKVTGLLRSPLRELFCTETDKEVTPEQTLRADPRTGRPKVLVVNLPVKLYGEVGRFAQQMVKTVWQHAADRRVREIEAGLPDWRPAFLWADEAQHFITSNDATFQQTARSAMIATVYLTQNLPNFYAAIGENATHSFLGNLQTKVFHANGEPTTNEWAERVFARELQPFLSEPLSGRGQTSHSYSYSPLIPAMRFTQLLKGGPTRRIGAYVFQAGRQWRGEGADRHYHEFVQPG